MVSEASAPQDHNHHEINVVGFISQLKITHVEYLHLRFMLPLLSAFWGMGYQLRESL